MILQHRIPYETETENNLSSYNRNTWQVSGCMLLEMCLLLRALLYMLSGHLQLLRDHCPERMLGA